MGGVEGRYDRGQRFNGFFCKAFLRKAIKKTVESLIMVKLGMGGGWLLVMVHMTCDTHTWELSLKLPGSYLLQFGNEDFEEKYKILNKERHPKKVAYFWTLYKSGHDPSPPLFWTPVGELFFKQIKEKHTTKNTSKQPKKNYKLPQNYPKITPKFLHKAFH